MVQRHKIVPLYSPTTSKENISAKRTIGWKSPRDQLRHCSQAALSPSPSSRRVVNKKKRIGTIAPRGLRKEGTPEGGEGKVRRERSE
jgi:hypothetical protein